MTRLFSFLFLRYKQNKEESCLVCTMGLKFYASIVMDYNTESLELSPVNIYF